MQVNASTEYGVKYVHDGVVGVGMCRLRVSARRSGGETRAASHSGDSLDVRCKDSQNVRKHYSDKYCRKSMNLTPLNTKLPIILTKQYIRQL